MCGHYTLLPKPLKIPICYDQASTALYRGGFADIWKGEYCGQDVAVKVMRTYLHNDLQKVVGVSGWIVLSFCALIVPYVAVLQGGHNMENPLPSKCPATDRSNGGRESICNDIRLGGGWKHQYFCESTSRCKSVGVGRLSIQSLTVFASSSLMIG